MSTKEHVGMYERSKVHSDHIRRGVAPSVSPAEPPSYNMLSSASPVPQLFGLDTPRLERLSKSAPQSAVQEAI